MFYNLSVRFFELFKDAQGNEILTIAIALFALLISFRSLHTSAAVNLRNKRADIISGCNSRYDSLAITKAVIAEKLSKILEEHPIHSEQRVKDLKPIQREIELYHRRYWGLKSDQIDYWLAGYVDPETLISWFMSTIDTVHEKGTSWTTHGEPSGGWDSVKLFHQTTNKRLYQIIECILSESVASMKPAHRYAYLFHLFKIIENAESQLIGLLKRNSRNRLTMDDFQPSLTPEVAMHLVPRDLEAFRVEAMHQSEARRLDREREAAKGPALEAQVASSPATFSP